MTIHYLYLRCLILGLALAALVLSPAQSTVVSSPTTVDASGMPATTLDISSQPESVVVPAASLGGSVRAVVVDGDFAYLGEGDALVILDLHDPAHPTRLGQLPLNGHIVSLQKVDSLVYALLTHEGLAGNMLQLINVRDPRQPLPFGYYEGVNDVQVVGGIAYIAVNYPPRLLLLYVRNPAGPTELGSYPTEGSPFDIEVTGDLAYVTGTLGAILIIDVHYPAQPRLVGRFESAAIELHVVANLLYAIGQNRLEIIDVRVPTQPILRGSAVIAATAHQIVAVQDSLVYVTASDANLPQNPPDTLLVFDVHDSGQPVLRGFFANSNVIAGIQVDGSQVYLAQPMNGLLILDLRNPALPTHLGYYRPLGDALGVQVVAGLAYIPAGSGGLQIVDVRDPAAPALHGKYETPESVRILAATQHFVYVSDQDNQLWIVDVRDPKVPRVRGRINLGDRIGHSQLVDETLYLTQQRGDAYPSKVQIVDVHDPDQPRLRGSYDLPGTIAEFHVQGNRVYSISNSMFGHESSRGYFAIADSANPDSPLIRGSFATTTTLGMQVENSRAYLIQQNAVQIVDASVPSAISFLGSYLVPASQALIRVVNQRAYAAFYPDQQAAGGPRLDIVDLQNPATPVTRGSYALGTNIVDVGGPFVVDLLIENDTVYVHYTISRSPGPESGALEIVNIHDPSNPSRLGLFVSSQISQVQLVGRLAYIVSVTRSVQQGLAIVDLSDPQHPSCRYCSTVLGFAVQLQVSGERVYLATSTGGLRVVLPHPELLAAVATIAAEGGTLTAHDDSLRLLVPAGALASTATLTYSGMLGPQQPIDPRYGILRNFAFTANRTSGEPLTHFAAGVTLTLSYTDELLTSQLITTEESLNLLYWNGRAWEGLLPCTGCGVDPLHNQFTITLASLGQYALVGERRVLFMPLISH